MVLNVWFNRWFSTVSHYIQMIRDNPDKQAFVIYGTHPNQDSVYLKDCDVSGTEPDISGEEYIQFCLDYCRMNKIDVFIPRKENVLIAKCLSNFKEIGVRVLVCPDSNLMELMDNKVAMYRSLEQNYVEAGAVSERIVDIPVYRIVNNAVDFKKAYKELTEQTNGDKLCIKPIIGEGANGFRIIDDQADTIPFLFNSAASQIISFETAFRILRQQKRFDDLMVLEYLNGYEYSIDCLAGEDGTLYAIIPRKKGQGRIRAIEFNEELITIAEKFAKVYKIPFVYNIQVRYKNGVPKLLEINPRMSGGLHISCLSGVNIPYYAVKLLLQGTSDDPINPQYGIRATHIEQAILLSQDWEPSPIF